MRYFSGLFTSMLYYQLALGVLIKLGHVVAPTGYGQHFLPIAFVLAGGSAGILCHLIVGVNSNFVLSILALITAGLVVLLSGIVPMVNPISELILYVSLVLSIYFTVRGYKWSAKTVKLKWHKSGA